MMGAFDMILWRSPKMAEVIQKAKIASQTDAPVLIEGETGTGKELLARAIYYESPRRDKPFVSINCCAIPKELFESELFGYEKGAFTGAISFRRGKFEMADTGVLFLDEISETAIEHQAKFLRVIQFGEIQRVGSDKNVKIDVRIIASSNKNLKHMMKQGLFRQDLYYRLCTIKIRIPPLRERKEDIPVLIEHFVEKYSQKYNRHIKMISSDVYECLCSYNFAGNVRELESIIHRGVLFCHNGKLSLDEILPSIQETRTSISKPEMVTNYQDLLKLRKQSQEQIDRAFVINLLVKTRGNVTASAKMAGIHRVTLEKMIKRLNINPKDFRFKV